MTLKTQNEGCVDEDNDIVVLKTTFPPLCQEETRDGEHTAPHLAATAQQESNATMASQASVKLPTPIYFSGGYC